MRFSDYEKKNIVDFINIDDDPCKHGLLQLSWQNYQNDIDNLFKALLNFLCVQIYVKNISEIFVML